MTAELIAESLSPAPGTTILVGIRMKPKPGWHGYWSNPGDAGFATSVSWVAPTGVKFGPLLHPPPELLTAAGISSYVHEGEHVLLSRMTVPSGLTTGSAIPIKAQLSWAACTATMCVPLRATLGLDLTVGDGDKGPDWSALNRAKDKLPRAASAGSFTSDGQTVRLTLPSSLRLDPAALRFFPDDNGAFETAKARAGTSESGIVIAGPSTGKLPRAISGVVSDRRVAYRLSFIREEPKPTGVVEDVSTAPGAAEPSASTTAKQQATANAPSEPPAKAPAKSSWPWLILAGALVAGSLLFVLRRRPSTS